jgi:hypothetical protein
MAPSEEFQSELPPERPPSAPRRQPLPRDEDDEERYRTSDDTAATIIPYRNPRALAAYYCGVFALIPCLGAVLGPIALILGILGLRYVGANPTAKGTGHAIAGIVLGSLTLLGNWGVLLFMLVGFILAASGK